MVRGLRVLILTLFVLGCANTKTATTPVGFMNQTRHSDAELWSIWSAAQNSLAAKINLNPLQSAADAPPDILPGDTRALSVMPHQLTVAPQTDVPSSVLAAVAGIDRANPTGLIPCPQPCNVRYTAAYSRYDPAAVRYAASWESSEVNFRDILEYEFENQILFALGYDVSWR
jgi:hypothetical protein